MLAKEAHSKKKNNESRKNICINLEVRSEPSLNCKIALHSASRNMVISKISTGTLETYTVSIGYSRQT